MQTTPKNARTQILTYTHEDLADKFLRRDWWSHRRRLAVDGNTAYHWKHNAVKSWNIRSHEVLLNPDASLSTEYSLPLKAQYC
jgi:hypothetical protein